MKNLGTMTTAAFAAGLLCVAAVAQAQQAAKPAAPPKGEAVVAAVQVKATVKAIDQKTRVVTLKAEDGKEFTFVADPAVQNLPQVKVGDIVTATYTEALAYEVKKGGKAVAASETVAGGAAELGAKPAGAIGRKVNVTVAITAIDPKVPSVTFKAASGETRTLKVKDPAKLQGVSVGDTVDLVFAEAVALKVEKAPK